MASIILYHNKNIEFIELLNKNNINESIKYFNKNKYSIILNQSIFDNCLKFNNIEICKFIYSKINIKNINFKYSLILLSITGCIDKFKWILSLNNSNNFNLIECINNAVENNNYEILKLLISEINDVDILSLNFIKLIKKSCSNGNEKIFELLYEKFPELNFSDEHYIYFYNSCLSDNVNLIDKIYNYSKDIDIYYTFGVTSLLDEIISLGNYKTFCWLIEKEDNLFYFNLKQYYFFEKSTYSNNLDLIKKIYSLINNKNKINYLKIITNLTNTNNNNNDIILYLENISGFNLLNTSFQIIKNIINNNNFELLNHIMKNYLKINEEIKFNYQNLIDLKIFNILLNLNTDQLKTFINFNKNNNIDIDLNENNLYYIVEHNNLKNIKLIFKNYCRLIKYDNDLLLRSTIKSNNIKKIKYIHDKILNKNINDINKILNFILLNSTINVYNYFKINNYIPSNLNIILIKLISKNEFNLFKYLFKYCKDKNNTIFLKECVRYNKSDFVKFCLKFLGNYENIEINIAEQMIINGDINILNNLKNKNYDFSKVNNDILYKICFSPKIELLRWILNLNLNFDEVKNKTFNLLVLNEYYDEAIFLYNNLKNIDLKYNEYSSLKNICYNGNSNILHWYLSKINEINFVKNTYLFKKLIDGDNYVLLKNYINENTNIEKYYIDYYFNYCLNKKYYQICNYLLKLYKKFDLTSDIELYFDEACINSDYVMLDLLMNINKNKNWGLYCIMNNYIEAFKYIFYYKKEFNINQNYLFMNSCFSGKLSISKWMYNNFDKIDYSLINTDNFLLVCRTLSLNMINWFYNLNSNIDLNFDEGYILKFFCTLNKYNLVSWVLKKNIIDTRIDNFICYKYSCYNKNLDMLKLLYNNNNNNYDIDFTMDNRYLFKLASNNNDTYTFKWMYFKVNNLDLTEFNYLYFRNAIVNDNLNLLLFLIEKSKIRDLNFNNNYLIKTIIYYRMIDTLKYVLIKFDNIDVVFDSNFAIKFLAEENDLEMMKLLYEYNNEIDLSIENEYLFINACINNNIEMAKWIISKKNDVNISVYKDFIFFQVCKYNFVEIAKYLKTLKENYFEFDIENISGNHYEIKNYKVLRCLEINNYKKVDSKETCPICYENVSNVISNCNHQFCLECVNNYYQRNYNFKCPICRKNDFSFFNIE